MDMDYQIALIGGMLIGLSALLLMLLLGRVAGISGIIWQGIVGRPRELWRWLFLLGMIGGGYIAHHVAGAPLPQSSQLPGAMAILGGLLVGVGVRLGNGCTSGHGVCGIALLSRRSIAATVVFMSTGLMTVYVIRHLLGLP